MTKKSAPPAPGALRYVGAGAWLMGVPARDLTPDEAARHNDAIKAAEAAGQVLYVPAPATIEEAPAGAKED